MGQLTYEAITQNKTCDWFPMTVIQLISPNVKSTRALSIFLIFYSSVNIKSFLKMILNYSRVFIYISKELIILIVDLSQMKKY